MIIPDYDPYIYSFVKEVTRWSGENILTVSLIYIILRELKIQALKTKNVVDDKIVSLLIYFFSFKWTKAIPNKEGDDNVTAR